MALRMGKDLGLPIEAVTEKHAFLGRTGQGKTYAALKLAEEIDRNNGQFIALDPVGVWWSLRLAADGKRRGIQIPVFGGLNGDIPLESTAGRLMADVVCDRGISVVLDVSQFDSDAQKNRFARDFGERFFFRKKAAPSAVHLFLEEAQEFVPQNLVGDGDRELLHVFTRMWKLGRNYGIGGSLITQRPQEVNKKVLNLTEVLFCFQLTGTHERKAVADWIRDKGLDLDVEQILPRLKRGYPHVWSPVLLGISRQAKIGARWTYDASSTPKVGSRPVVKTLAPIDLQKLQKDMAATIEKAKTTDPKLLQKRVRELEEQVAKKVPVQKVVGEKIKRIEVPVIGSQLLKKIDRLTPVLLKTGNAVTELAAEIRSAVDRAAKMDAAARTTQSGPTKMAIEFPITIRQQKPEPKGYTATLSNGRLPEGEKTILKAVAQLNGATKQQLTIVTGYKRSTRDAYLARLNGKGLIRMHGQQVSLQPAGMEILHAHGGYERLPTGTDLQAYWLANLPDGESKVLAVVCSKHPEAATPEQIEESTGYKRSTRDAYLSRLKARHLVRGDGRSGYLAVDDLFDEA